MEEVLESASRVLEQFRNYCGLIKIARCGFLWEKTTKRPISSRISCIATLAEDNDVRLSLRKVACSSVAPTTSTGNPGSVYTNCETALADWPPIYAHPPSEAIKLSLCKEESARWTADRCISSGEG